MRRLVKNWLACVGVFESPGSLRSLKRDAPSVQSYVQVYSGAFGIRRD